MTHTVIPGRAEGASPESITTNHSMSRGRRAFSCFLVMDPGLAAARRPGMTIVYIRNTPLPVVWVSNSL